ncbi:MAG: hypothetical protein AB7G48_09660 [Nitrospiraceae bacterium]
MLALVACSMPDWDIPSGLESESAVRQRVLALIPVGTPLIDAKQRMESNGFTCVFQWHGLWDGRQDASYLYCHREEGGLIHARQWQVAFPIHTGTVMEALVVSGMIAPPPSP